MIEEYLDTLLVLGSKPGLDTIRALLQEIGSPQECKAFIHVAGTNGKGSVSLMLASILHKMGCKVGRYSSPHLTSYCERFTVNNVPITPDELNAYLEIIKAAIERMLAHGLPHPTEFEVLTAAAFLFFRDQNVDIAVLEVGMGGIYDATNVIIPLVSVITSISYDHTAFLGNTIEAIAWNKAGIIKSGVPVVVGNLPDEAQKTIEAQAVKLNSSIVSSQIIHVDLAEDPGLYGQMIRVSGAWDLAETLYFSLPGLYQLENLATALTALYCLTNRGLQISAAATREGLKNLSIGGRMQVLHEKPLVIADAAHNEGGSKALARSLAEILPGRNKVAVIGIVDDKDARNMLLSLGDRTRAVVFTRPEGDRSAKWKRLALIWQELFPDGEVYLQEDIGRAVKKGMHLLGDEDYLLVTGSFYVLRQACRYQF